MYGTADSAGNNRAMMKGLELKYKYANLFSADHHSILCFSHILSIAVIDLLYKGSKVKLPTGDFKIYV